jgi:hypothetical protein
LKTNKIDQIQFEKVLEKIRGKQARTEVIGVILQIYHPPLMISEFIN